jgi:hypothetical protein
MIDPHTLNSSCRRILSGALVATVLCAAAQAGGPGRYVRPGPRHGPGHLPGPLSPPGRVLRSLPPGYHSLMIGGAAYFEHGGVYFQVAPGGYVVVEPPQPVVVIAPPAVGSFVLSLPVGCMTVSIGGAVYFRDGDIFYRHDRGGYVVVERPREIVVVQPPAPPPPVVTVVTPVPSPTATYLGIEVNGSPFYYRDGEFYRKVVGGFQVIDAPVGAVIPALPTGATTMWIGDDEYVYLKGAFYRRNPQGFAVVTPPTNTYVKALPREAKEVWCGGLRYRCLHGAFYTEADQGWLIATPPIVLTPGHVTPGTAFAAPPDGSVEVWVNDSGFLYFSGTFYRRTPTGCVAVPSPL